MRQICGFFSCYQPEKTLLLKGSCDQMRHTYQIISLLIHSVNGFIILIGLLKSICHVMLQNQRLEIMFRDEGRKTLRAIFRVLSTTGSKSVLVFLSKCWTRFLSQDFLPSASGAQRKGWHWTWLLGNPWSFSPPPPLRPGFSRPEGRILLQNLWDFAAIHHPLPSRAAATSSYPSLCWALPFPPHSLSTAPST